jgi:hypothetical protein
MTARTEFLDTLRTKVRAPIEEHADEILDSFGDDNERLAAFQRARADLDSLIARLETEEFAGLRKQMAANEAEFKTGVASLESTLKGVKDLESAARVFWRIVGLAARIIALA